MKKLSLLFYVLVFSLAAFAPATAQAQATYPPPPNLIVMVREEIKPGKMQAHEQEAASFIQVMNRANSRLAQNLRGGRIGMTPIGGNENEVSYLWAYDSFADMETRNRAMDELAAGPMKADFDALVDHEYHASQRDIVASFRPDYSYRIGTVNIAETRYMTVTTLRLKPGHEAEYWEMVKKIVNPARDRIGLKASFAVYQVRAGAPNGTYLIFRAIKNLSELDTNLPAMRQAMGDQADDADRVADRAIISSETTLYAFNPRVSLVSPEFAARDTATTPFWNPKPPVAAATAAAQPARGQRRNGRRSNNH